LIAVSINPFDGHLQSDHDLIPDTGPESNDSR